mmetsp:Transcript_6985/g.21292  ORF Transcript_6985/g.21292 Transcript_6985/m.21292 type:complete len:334 (+) Transcript_6985:2531-3532(+)
MRGVGTRARHHNIPRFPSRRGHGRRHQRRPGAQSGERRLRDGHRRHRHRQAGLRHYLTRRQLRLDCRRREVGSERVRLDIKILPVPAHCQHRGHRRRLRRLHALRDLAPRRRPDALGQRHHGLAGFRRSGLGAAHRSAPRPPAVRQEETHNNASHVVQHDRPGHLPGRHCLPAPLLQAVDCPGVRDRRRRRLAEPSSESRLRPTSFQPQERPAPRTGAPRRARDAPLHRHFQHIRLNAALQRVQLATLADGVSACHDALGMERLRGRHAKPSLRRRRRLHLRLPVPPHPVHRLVLQGPALDLAAMGPLRHLRRRLATRAIHHQLRPSPPLHQV